MITKLDASHRCVLKNWAAIARMNDCRAQIETHLKEVMGKVLRTLYHQYRNDFVPDKTENDYFQLYPVRAANWKNSNLPLLFFGVECITVERLLHLTSEPTCSAYVYSQYREATINDSATDELGSITPTPSGFARTFDQPARGYIFQQPLPALSPENFSDLAKLERYLTEPVMTLIEWYRTHEAAILNAVSPAPEDAAST